MKRLPIIGLAPIFFLFLISPLTAQVQNLNEMTVVIPAESIAKFIKPLLPYRIEFGKNVSGSFWIKSIENIKINQDRILFSSHIYGKDIEYSTKIGNQIASIVVGDVNLHNHWQASLNYDKTQKKLFIKPQMKNPDNKKDLSQGDLLLNTLLKALSDIEYPIEVNKLKPIRTEFHDQILIIEMDISDIYAADNKLFIEIIPTPKIDGANRPS